MLKPMIRPVRRGRPRKAEEAQLQDEFLDHRLQQFPARGYRSTTMDNLARGFGASKATLYARCGSRAGLVLAAMEQSVSGPARRDAAWCRVAGAARRGVNLIASGETGAT